MSAKLPSLGPVLFSACLLAAGALSGISAHAGVLGSRLIGPDTAHVSSPLSAVQPISVSGKSDAAGTDETSKRGRGAQNFVQTLAEKALAVIANTKLSPSQKKTAFSKLLQDGFDMETIGRFSLGTYWRISTEQQRKEYQSLFREMVVSVYSNRFEGYKGEKFEARSFRMDNEKDAIVSSVVIPVENPEVHIDWRVRYKNGQYQIVDVIVEGVSMSMTQRSDFSSVIQQGGGDVQSLLTHLKTALAENNAAQAANAAPVPVKQ